MKFSIATAAAAINQLAEQTMSEAGIAPTDADAMARTMETVERLVGHEMARQGMNLQEALELASGAALQTGRETRESRALAEDAFRNRNADAPTDVQAPADGPAVPQTAVDAGSDELIERGDDETAGDDVPRPAPAFDRAPAPPAARPHVVIEQPAMRYTVVNRKVHEVFSGIAPGTTGFDFDVPVVNWVGRHPKVPAIDPHYNYDATQLMTLLYAISEGVSLNIVGPHGAGKTQLVLQIAARLNYPVTVLPMDGQLSRRELIGQEKLRAGPHGAESYFAPGLLPRALAEPGFILFDEIDRGVSDLQYACHSVYLQEGLTVLEDGGRFIPFHPHNRVFATANTKGRGSMDGMYQPPEEMSEATRDRWSIWMEVDYQTKDEDVQVLMAKMPDLPVEHAEMIAKIGSEIREAYRQERISQTCSMRNMLDIARYAKFMVKGERDPDRRDKCLALAMDRVWLGRANDADRTAIRELVKASMPHVYLGAPLF